MFLFIVSFSFTLLSETHMIILIRFEFIYFFQGLPINYLLL